MWGEREEGREERSEAEGKRGWECGREGVRRQKVTEGVRE